MGEGEQWLQTAIEIARYLVAQQRTDGSWLNRADFEHTFPVKAPWRSGMAQGEGASLLVRVHTETGDATYADAARRALAPLGRAREDEGTLAWIDGRPWPEEYPTRRPSYVLNGAIFAWWGMRDVGVGLGCRTCPDSVKRTSALGAPCARPRPRRDGMSAGPTCQKAPALVQVEGWVRHPTAAGLGAPTAVGEPGHEVVPAIASTMIAAAASTASTDDDDAPPDERA